MKNNKILLFFTLIVLSLSSTMLRAQTISMNNGTETMNSESWTFFDPWSYSENYENGGEEEEWIQTFTSEYNPNGRPTPSGFYFKFQIFALNPADTLYIYDGADINAPLIGAFGSVNTPGTDEFGEGVVVSSGVNITFRFKHLGRTVFGMNRGWRAKVTPYWETSSSVNVDAATSRLTSDQFLCNMDVYDDGGATGNITGNGTKILVVESSEGSFKVETELFNIGSGTLEIYDGDLDWDSYNARRIGYFKAGYPPPPVFFTSQYSITFKLTGGSGASGFKFALSCVPVIFEQSDTDPCPKIEIGRKDLNDFLAPFASVETIEANAYDPIIYLTAKTISPGKYTSDYTVKEISWQEEWNDDDFYHGGDLIAVPNGVDDKWLGLKPLTPVGDPNPFSFAFYGTNDLTHVTPGTNAALSFNEPGSGTELYEIMPILPNIGAPDFSAIGHKNSILGVFQDTDPRPATISPRGVWYGNSGEYPCRTFENANFELPLYHHTSPNDPSTYKIIMYEGTNTIDVIIRERTCCPSKNGGNATLGILNAGGNQAVIPEGWNSVRTEFTHKAYRFTPISPPDCEVHWYELGDNPTPGNRLASGINFPLEAPREDMGIVAEMVFTTSSNITYNLYDTVHITVDIPPIVLTADPDTVCFGETIELFATTEDEDLADTIAMVHWSDTLDRFGDLIEPFLDENGDTVNTVTYEVLVTEETVGDSAKFYCSVIFDNGFYTVDSITIYSSPIDSIFLTASDTIICEGETVSLNVETEAPRFEWDQFENLQANTTQVTPLEDITYSVTSYTAVGCESYDTISIKVNPNPNASFVPNPPTQYVEDGRGEILFQNLSTPETGVTYLWNYGDEYCIPAENESTDIDGFHNYTNAGRFTVSLTVATEEGECIDSTSTVVRVEVPYDIFFPNAFTPNGDGINDVFGPKGRGVDTEGYDMKIYTRTGELIFSSTSLFDYWDGKFSDGKDAPGGVYVYIVTAQNMDKVPKTYNGTITLIR